MTNLITDPNELLNPPYDKFLDTAPTRREMQRAFNKMGRNDADLMGMVDNAALVLNCLCEKLGVTRAELDAYRDKKQAELKAREAGEFSNG